MLDTATETHTMRNKPSETRVADAANGTCPPVGDGLGGAGTHWNGVTWRFTPSEFVLRSHLGAALRHERHPRRHDDPGLGHHL